MTPDLKTLRSVATKAARPKTAQEIRVELAEKIKAWRAEPITCDDCRPSAQSCTSGNVQFRSHDAALNPTGVGEAG